MRNIAVVTVARSDYGIYLPIIRAIEEDANLKLRLVVSGSHLSPEFGMTISEIETDGFEIAERLEMLVSSDTAGGMVKSIGLGSIGFADIYSRMKPDIVVVLGDRFEMHVATMAALPFTIPVAHIHGGEITEGAIDDSLRHSITKLSHIHFTATEDSERRVLQMGEQPWRVIRCGAPGLDNVRTTPILGLQELSQQIGVDLDSDTFLVTYHPVSLELQDTEWQVGQLLESLCDYDAQLIFTYPNSDAQGRLILEMLAEFVHNRTRAYLVSNLGTQNYFSLMSHSAVMIGNSSSGLIEAPAFNLPVVNVGSRQQGRTRGKNVIDVGYDKHLISQGINKAISPGFQGSLVGMVNPYGDGYSSQLIIDKLKNIPLNHDLIAKKFSEFH